jgi:hypothetical protein
MRGITSGFFPLVQAAGVLMLCALIPQFRSPRLNLSLGYIFSPNFFIVQPCRHDLVQLWAIGDQVHFALERMNGLAGYFFEAGCLFGL